MNLTLLMFNALKVRKNLTLCTLPSILGWCIIKLVTQACAYSEKGDPSVPIRIELETFFQPIPTNFTKPYLMDPENEPLLHCLRSRFSPTVQVTGEILYCMLAY